MDDPRIEWLRDRVYEALDIQGNEVFEELLERDDGEYERRLGKYLNDTPEEGETAILFYKVVREEEEEVEVECEPEIPDIEAEEDLGEGVEGDGNETADGDEEIQALPTSDPDVDADTEQDSESTDVGKKGKKKKPAKDGVPKTEKTPEPPATSDVPDQPEENGKEENGEENEDDNLESMPKTKIIIQKVWHTYLYMCYEHMPEEISDTLCIYFLRNTTGMVPLPSSLEEAEEILPSYFEYSLLNAHSLVMLEQIIRMVYMPLLSYYQHKNGGEDFGAAVKTPAKITSREDTGSPASKVETGKQTDAVESRSKTLLRDEFLINMQKFASAIARTLQQIEGEVRLEVPDVEIPDSIEEALKDEALVEFIHEKCLNWKRQMQAALENLQQRNRQGNGPLAEIDYWRERNAALSALLEQLKMPKVAHMIDIHIAADGDFEDLQSELNKYYIEAKDNVRFLSTLERHFKNVTYGASFRVVTETIPSMMNALRMVWIISRHYNKDERMVPLMERIAWELAERVAKVINVRELFSLPTDEVKKRTSQAKTMLTTWREAYQDVRQKIEASGRDQRWEFDRKRLFERTDYMANICQNLYDIAQVLEEFYNIFGPELKAVTGDPARIEEVLLRVDKLVDPVENLSFDAFSQKEAHLWKRLMTNFYKEVAEIENEAKTFIDESFQSLRSAEGAFDMLLNFKHLRSREAINNQMMQKFKDILVQYGKEVDTMDQLFNELKDNPPLYKGYPPTAGSIFWNRSLFHRIKHTIIRFQTLDEMVASDMGKSTKAKYLSVGRNMRAYEELKYEQWKENVEAVLPGLLKRNLLVKQSYQIATPTPTQHSATGSGDKEEERHSAAEIQGTVKESRAPTDIALQ
ncbi:unnamed protein product, partial [Candidula unifasciata]